MVILRRRKMRHLLESHRLKPKEFAALIGSQTTNFSQYLSKKFLPSCVGQKMQEKIMDGIKLILNKPEERMSKWFIIISKKDLKKRMHNERLYDEEYEEEIEKK